MKQQDIRIAFLGDSLVNGTGDETYLGWTGRVCSAAHNEQLNITHYNLGIRRNTSRDIERRWSQECTLRFTHTSDNRIVLSCGVNDTVIENGKQRVTTEETLENITKILCEAKSIGYTSLLLSPLPTLDHKHNQRLRMLIEEYHELANAIEIPFINVFESLLKNPIYRQALENSDHFHPKSSGYQQVATVIQQQSSWWF